MVTSKTLRPSIASKRRHGLHECVLPDEFLHCLEREAGPPTTWHPSGFIRKESLSGLVLGGSIPLGVGTSASDIDLIAVVAEERDVPSSPPRRDGVVFTGVQSNEVIGRSTNIVVYANDIEIDIVFISLAGINRAEAASYQTSTSPTSPEMTLLARLQRGWLLFSNEDFKQRIASARANQIIPVRCCVSNFVAALKTLEDAAEALNENTLLALHLGRLSVDRAMQAYLASEGLTYLGNKWLRVMAKTLVRNPDQLKAKILHQSEGLLFPTLAPEENGAARYLDEVCDFLSVLKREIERVPAFRLAFQLCPQITDPQHVI